MPDDMVIGAVVGATVKTFGSRLEVALVLKV
jgi:hypothetical protein